MRRSVLFNRVFGVVILAIMITALFTTLIFNYMCTSVFTHIKENELIPRARALAAVIEDYGQHLMPEWDSQVLSAILNANDEGEMLLGAYSVITDKEGNVILSSGALRQDVLDSIGEAVAEVVQRGELRTKQIPPLRHTSMVTVGVPILGEGEVLGAVLLMVPLVEATLAMGSLNSALFMSALLALPVVAVMVYWAVGRVTRPLRQMRDVAVGMAGGNFEARADASQRGKWGNWPVPSTTCQGALPHHSRTDPGAQPPEASPGRAPGRHHSRGPERQGDPPQSRRVRDAPGTGRP